MCMDPPWLDGPTDPPMCRSCGQPCYGGCKDGDDHYCEECCRPDVPDKSFDETAGGEE